MKENNKIKKWLYWFSLAVAVIFVYKLFNNFTSIGDFFAQLTGVLMPFILGILIAYILYIPCRSVEQCYQKLKSKFLKKRARGLAIFTVYLIIAMIVFILINIILPPIITSVADLANHLPEYYATLIKIINDLPEDSFWVKINAKELIYQLSSVDMAQYLSVENITSYIRGAISVASGIFDVFVTIIISIYTLRERTKIVQFLKKVASSLFKDDAYLTITSYFKKTNSIFFNFISGQIIDAVIVGIITSLAMTILGVKYAALLGFLIGLFNLIPFFGAIVAVGIAIFITLCTGGFLKALWLAIVIIILQQIDANIINPKIIGDKLQISPILVIFSVTIGGAWFGVLGMFLAVPIMAILKLILLDYLDYKERKKKYTI